MLIKRSVFLDLDGFDEDYFAYFEDVDIGWRCWLAAAMYSAPKTSTSAPVIASPGVDS